MGRLAELYSRLLHGADLSPSDEFVSLILLSAAQRQSRQAHVRNALKLYKQQTAAAQQKADTVDAGDAGRAPPPPPSHDPSKHPSQSEQHVAHSLSHEQTTQSKPQVVHNRYNADQGSSQGSKSEVSSRSVHQTNGQSQCGLRSDASIGSQSVTEGHAAPDSLVGKSAEHSAHLQKAGSSKRLEMEDTLSRIHTPNAADDRGLTGSPEPSPLPSRTGSQSAEQRGGDSHVIDIPHEGNQALPPQCSASLVHGPAGGKVKRRSQPASSKKADVQDLKNMEEGNTGTDSQTDTTTNAEAGKQMHHSRKSSRRHLNQDEFFERDFMLAPSSYACEYDPDVAPDKLADIYTGEGFRRLDSALSACLPVCPLVRLSICCPFPQFCGSFQHSGSRCGLAIGADTPQDITDH